MKTKYDDEELEILKSLEKNQLKISKTRKLDLRDAIKSAKDTIEKQTELRIKLTETDLKNLKLKEIETGISYQNIVEALIHKYLEDKIDLTI
jgi:predicted DNA binding CopG/RHH family protein